jgi:hypothetical protein
MSASCAKSHQLNSNSSSTALSRIKVMTPRFPSTPETELKSSRSDIALDVMAKAEQFERVALLLALTEHPKREEVTMLVSKMLVYYTARHGGLHLCNFIANASSAARHAGMTDSDRATMVDYVLFLFLENDMIKITPSLLIGARLSHVLECRMGVQNVEASYAAQQNREPIDFYSDSYVRKLPLEPYAREGASLTEIIEGVRLLYAPFIAAGEPLANPSDFLL